MVMYGTAAVHDRGDVSVNELEAFQATVYTSTCHDNAAAQRKVP